MAGEAPNISNIPNLAATGVFSGATNNGKPLHFCGIPLEWGAAGQMSLQACAPLGKQIPALMVGTGKAGGAADKFLQRVAAIQDDLKQIASGAQAMYAGDVPTGTSVSPGIRGGGGAIEIG